MGCGTAGQDFARIETQALCDQQFRQTFFFLFFFFIALCRVLKEDRLVRPLFFPAQVLGWRINDPFFDPTAWSRPFSSFFLPPSSALAQGYLSVKWMSDQAAAAQRLHSSSFPQPFAPFPFFPFSFPLFPCSNESRYH